LVGGVAVWQSAPKHLLYAHIACWLAWRLCCLPQNTCCMPQQAILIFIHITFTIEKTISLPNVDVSLFNG